MTSSNTAGSDPRGPDTAASFGGWKSTAVQVGLLVVAGFSVVILFSFGGQLIVAPALLPAQWLIARHTRGRMSMAFSVLGAVLVAEVVWLILGLAIGDGAVFVLGIGAMAVGVAAGVGFFYSSRPVE